MTSLRSTQYVVILTPANVQIAELLKGADPTGGFVDYSTFDEAIVQKLISNATDYIYLGVDNENTVPETGVGRPSVRLESKLTFTEGLFVLDLRHLPVGCGTWPAFWTVGLGKWPSEGEIGMQFQTTFNN